MELNLEKLRSRQVNSKVTRLVVQVLGSTVSRDKRGACAVGGRERTQGKGEEKGKERIRVDQIITSRTNH